MRTLRKVGSEKAITLIALVVTIVILLILAGVTITMTLSQNGLFAKALEAKEETEVTRIEEQRKLAQAEAIINTEKTQYNGLTLPEGFAPTRIEGEDSIDEGLVITDGKGNEYVWIEVPKDIYNNTNYNNNENNKPKDLNDYSNIYEVLKNYTNEFNDVVYEDNESVAEKYIENYVELKNCMLQSVYTNGGFWIGRYEAGYGDTYRTSSDLNNIDGIVPTSKIDQVPIIFVTRSNAEKIAERVESGNLKSSLMFGIQYKLTLKFMKEKGTNLSELKESSENWGNYVTSSFKVTRKTAKYGMELNAVGKNGFLKESGSDVILTTGASNRNSKKNIYDLAGNVWEWTLGTTTADSYNCIIRWG